MDSLVRNIPRFADIGINVLVLEVDYNFMFESHPELRGGKDPIKKETASKISEACRDNRIRLIPEFQCLGHQSWAKETFPLLIQYPEFDLTPGAYPGNDSIYCREWDPTNPEVMKIVRQLLDELIDAFNTDAIHVGMDEVFLLGDSTSPATLGKNPAELYAKAVNDLHNYITKERGCKMLMWGDRLIDGSKFDFGEWESSLNGTASAIDMIPKDIIICDWHYDVMDSYPSIPMFLEKGFRVLPSGWKNTDATVSLIEYSFRQNDPGMLGHLFTTWGVSGDSLLRFPPLIEGVKKMKQAERLH
ncbi:MAG: family 20 glycosylhydrolase [Candidatus Marinimicrobia bacterium]|nr:family 20 glycosylhydrolase [Candidatus Neomarinimicrobiota bacterium]